MTRKGAPLACIALMILLSFSALALNEPSIPEDIDEITSIDISDETYFTMNMGQWDGEFEYIGTTSFGALGLGNDGIFFNVQLDEDSGQVVKYSFVDSNPEDIRGTDRLSHVSNYYLGNDPAHWASSVPNFETVSYVNLWDDIDLKYSSRGSLKYEFILNPYSDPNEILIEVEGANDLILEDTEVRIQLDNGAFLKDSDLLVYYGDDHSETIDAGFVRKNGNTFGFELQKYDRSRPVVIDPFILTSTFLGSTSSGDERLGTFVQDEDGNFYGAATTQTTNFPTTTGVYSTTSSGWDDMVVFKMDSTLSNLNYSTYLGGSQSEQAGPIGLGPNGSIYVGGLTFSNDFPTTAGAYDTTYQPSGTIFSETDGVVARLDDNCTELGFGTYLGVRYNETVTGLSVDSSGHLVLTGTVESSSFPVTNDAYDSTHNGGIDMFVAKMNTSGDKLLHSTFIGGNGYDACYGRDFVSDDILYMTGITRSNNFPTTSGAYDTTFNGGSAGFNSFVMKYNISSGSLDLSTFMGVAYGSGIKVNETGTIYVVGQTTDSNFPTTTGAYDRSRNGQEDCVYFKLNPSMSQLLYSTFIGGAAWDSFVSIDLNSTGSPFMIGRTRSTDYPTTKGCYDDTHGGGWDIVVTRMNPQGDRLVYSTYLGGTSDEHSSRIYVKTEDTAVIGGYVESNTYPTTTGAYDTTHNGGTDIVFSEIDMTLVLMPPEKPLNLTGVMTGDKVNLQWEAPEDDGGSPILLYKILRGTIPTALVEIDTTTDLQYEDTGLDIREVYYYTVVANNSQGDSQRAVVQSFWELVPPVFNGDFTPLNPLPGTEITFTANFTDNVEVDSANVEFWTSGMRHVNESMENTTGDNIWTYTIPLDDVNTDIFYKFSAVDIKGNRIGTETFTREIRGEVYPILWNDQTPKIASPSTEFTFLIDVRDNHQVDQVKVEFWVDGGALSSNFMDNVEGTDTYTLTITVPNVMDLNLHYFFSARDNDLKWSRTMEKIVPIMDVLRPVFLADNSDTEGSTGSPLALKVELQDNLYISSVSAEYWFDGGSAELRSMVKGVGKNWRTIIDVPITAASLHYRFTAMDPAGNTNSTITKSVNITDTISPVVLNDSTDQAAYCGSIFTFRVKAGDNIGVLKANVIRRINEEEPVNLTLSGSGEIFRAVISIPMDVTGALYYSIGLMDTSGRYIETGGSEVEIIDLIFPTIQEINDVVRYQGEEISITANATDNIGVKTISWNGAPISTNNLVLEGELDSPGTYEITVVVTDPSGNSASTGFILLVLPEDHDGDADGIPDLVEDELGLDKFHHFDGYSDMDSDGLDNWVEYSLGLSLTDPDTDGDGMPDDWEYENGLDPLVPSSANDPDSDGISDLEEFQQGTDPRVWNGVETKTEEYNATFLIILLILFIIALLAIWGFVGFRSLRGTRTELPPLPDPEEKEEEELEKMLHDLPDEQSGQAAMPQLDAFDFEPAPDEGSTVSDLFSEQEPPAQEELAVEEQIPPEQEPPTPEGSQDVDQEPVEEQPFAEQPIETLDAGEVIQ